MNKMKERIKELEQLARVLEVNKVDREKIRNAILNYTEGFLDNLPSKKAYSASDNQGKELTKDPIRETGISVEKAIRLMHENVDNEGINPASGGHLGYIPGGGLYTSSLGDYWADITNRYAGIYFANPGAVRLENQLIRWMAKMVGYPETATGNLTSGGSIANLIALVVARDKYQIRSTDIPRTVIYTTRQVHHCIQKALKIAGLYEASIRYVDQDEHHRLIPDSLENSVRRDKKNGMKPWLIIASAGTTDVGAIDPLDSIADIAREHDLWYHIDAAYGGFFMLTSEGVKKMKGIHRSDSIVMDPHKSLFLPYGLGVVLCKDREAMQKSLHYTANYMQDAVEDYMEVSPADVSPELTKHFRGLRFWLPLKLHGVAPFRAALEEKLLLAKYAYQRLNEIPDMETGPEPELSVVTFRYIPPGNIDPNQFNKQLLKEIHRDGRIFISSSTVNDKYILRFAILVFRTHLKHIDLAISMIREKSELLMERYESKSTS